ncbi:hypothetical protein [Synechococcus sp. A15-28]|uniref:hypothetical protein n=1 Tax=Synechococcus sp. A15-28 TaxID=1050638 RepID=UPI0016464788|nr:hypothetical protein [Synechococcus sp. A15-28]
MYSREVINVANKIKKGSYGKGLNAIIDLKWVKPKYGELIHALNCISTLKALGVVTNIYIFEAEKSGLWSYEKENKTNKTDKVGASVYENIGKINDEVLAGRNIEIIRVTELEREKTIIKNLEGTILFEKLVQANMIEEEWVDKKKVKNFFTLTRELYSLLTALFHKRLEAYEENYLFGDRLREKYRKKNTIGEYMTTNFRYNRARPIKNNNPFAIMETITNLYNEYGQKTIILTCKEGRDYLNSIYTRNKLVLFGNSGNFMDEIITASQSRLHYQINGGGISEVCILSKDVNYVLYADAIWVTPYSSQRLYRYNSCPGQTWINERSNHETYEYMIRQNIEMRLT